MAMGMCKLFATAAAALVLVVAPARAETRPDFTGNWKVNNAKSSFGSLPVPQSIIQKVDHKDPNLKMSVVMADDAGERTYEVTVTTDGKECTNFTGNTIVKSKLNWDGNALVMEHRGGDVVVKDRWSLSEDGKTLTIVRQWSGSQGEVTQTLVSEKQ